MDNKKPIVKFRKLGKLDIIVRVLHEGKFTDVKEIVDCVELVNPKTSGETTVRLNAKIFEDYKRMNSDDFEFVEFEEYKDDMTKYKTLDKLVK